MDEEEFADLGAIFEQFDPQSAFALQMKYRTACRNAFADEDCSSRVAKSSIHRIAPISGDYAVGEFISFRRVQGAVTPGLPDLYFSSTSSAS